VLVAVLVDLVGGVDDALLGLVALVGQQHARDGRAVAHLHLRVQVLLPLEHRIERRRPRHVEHDERAHRLLVVHARHVAEPLLACNTQQLSQVT